MCSCSEINIVSEVLAMKGQLSQLGEVGRLLFLPRLLVFRGVLPSEVIVGRSPFGGIFKILGEESDCAYRCIYTHIFTHILIIYIIIYII